MSLLKNHCMGVRFTAAICLSLPVVCSHELFYDEIKRKLYLNIVKVLLKQEDHHNQVSGSVTEIEQLIQDAYEMAQKGFRNPFLTFQFKTHFKLIGIGALIHLFISDVAQMLSNEAIVPRHYEVANAI